MSDRGTGLTTAMLEQAFLRKQANGGTAVRVIVHSSQMIHYCRSIAPQLATRDFVVLARDISRRLRGLTREQVFIDHAVWELGEQGSLDNLAAELHFMRRSPDPQRDDPTSRQASDGA
jgi:hypothetical protein